MSALVNYANFIKMQQILQRARLQQYLNSTAMARSNTKESFESPFKETRNALASNSSDSLPKLQLLTTLTNYSGSCSPPTPAQSPFAVKLAMPHLFEAGSVQDFSTTTSENSLTTPSPPPVSTISPTPFNTADVLYAFKLSRKLSRLKRDNTKFKRNLMKPQAEKRKKLNFALQLNKLMKGI